MWKYPSNGFMKIQIRVTLKLIEITVMQNNHRSEGEHHLEGVFPL